MLKTQQNKRRKYTDNPEGRTSIHILAECICAEREDIQTPYGFEGHIFTNTASEKFAMR